MEMQAFAIVKSHYIIDFETLRELDCFFDPVDADQYEQEIEAIVSGLWQGCECESIMKPLYTTFLQICLLRALYIDYFSIKEINKIYSKVTVTASTTTLDIVGGYFGLNMDRNRSNCDSELHQFRPYTFLGLVPFWREIARGCRFVIKWISYIQNYKDKKVDVLYRNAGKLQRDFAKIPRAFDAGWIPAMASNRFRCNPANLAAQIRKNIQLMKLSIPNELVMELVERRVISYLPETIQYIGTLAEFIEKHKVRLVIISAATHEEHLVLLAAANLMGVESLVIGHGFTGPCNPFLHYAVTHQATNNRFEIRYDGANQWRLRMDWFVSKV